MKVAFLTSIAQLNRSVSRLLMHYHLLSNSYFCAVPSDRYTQLKSQKLKVKSKNLGSVILLFWLCWMKVAFLTSIAQLNRSVSRLLMHYHLLSNSYCSAEKAIAIHNSKVKS
ncbi:hypothetical protein [Okeania sp. KiyG1]|uniref:hypothetical protein n=1 Tax=Okeania sp. KiyG1 TaxID=2720165 RepID=UPI001923129E|nr:hypothetical protein [Okeania sp. KiyG1]